MSLSCGGKAGSPDPPIAVDDGADAGIPSVPGPDAEPPAVESDPIEPSAGWSGIGEVASVADGDSPATDVVALGVLELLETYCAECHSNGENGAGFTDGLVPIELIDRGMIVPGSSEASPLVQRMLDGSMPPSGVRPRPTAGDIALIASFIDQLPALAPQGCDASPFLGQDEIYAALLADVRSRPAEDRPFLRYFSLAYASNARLCGAALDQQRHALFKLVNSLSTASDIRIPASVDDSRLLHRIDLRDYGWARPNDLDDDGAVDYPDGWAAILPRVGPYAVELTGAEATALAFETGTPVPLLPVNAFVQAASYADVYYGLLGMRATIDDTQLDLGIDLVVAMEDRNVRRALFGRGTASDNDDVMVTRVPQGAVPERSYWQLEVDELVRSESFYSDPLDISEGSWSQSIFALPNGLLAYSVNDAGGSRLAQIPRGCVDVCAAPQRDHAVACFGCHARGLLPLDDVMRGYVETYSESYDAETAAAIRDIFPGAAELDQLTDGDNATYLAALERAGVPADVPDPISSVSLQFNVDPIDLERAAAELGVTSSTLSENLGRLPPALAPLGAPAGTIERAAFGEAFIEALCTLHARSRNRPLACP